MILQNEPIEFRQALECAGLTALYNPSPSMRREPPKNRSKSPCSKDAGGGVGNALEKRRQAAALQDTEAHGQDYDKVRCRFVVCVHSRLAAVSNSMCSR